MISIDQSDLFSFSFCYILVIGIQTDRMTVNNAAWLSPHFVVGPDTFG